MAENCPLCQRVVCDPYWSDRKLSYFHCKRCDLVFLARHLTLSLDEQRKHYDSHQNSPEDLAYRNFLSQLSEPLIARLPPGARGLDVGCGPGPTLSWMLKNHGFDCSHYDPIYFADSLVWSCQYDFITATEVVEHLLEPRTDLTFWLGHLKPGGLLAVMTKRDRPPSDHFAKWSYRMDRTHVCFWTDQTCHYLAEEFNLRIQFVNSRVVLFKKL